MLTASECGIAKTQHTRKGKADEGTTISIKESWNPLEIFQETSDWVEAAQRELELHTQLAGICERCTQRDKRPSRIKVVWGDTAPPGQEEGEKKWKAF